MSVATSADAPILSVGCPPTERNSDPPPTPDMFIQLVSITSTATSQRIPAAASKIGTTSRAPAASVWGRKPCRGDTGRCVPSLAAPSRVSCMSFKAVDA